MSDAGPNAVWGFPGVIVMWGGTEANVPPGWLYCNGQAISQQQYHQLFAVVGLSFGANPPVGQFYLPDLRGRFVRGVDAGAGRDPDVASRTDMQNSSILSQGVGSVQSHAFQNHTHPYQKFPTDRGGIAGTEYWTGGQAATGLADSTQYQCSTETRPINAYLNFIIKY